MTTIQVEVYNNETYQRKYDIAELFKHLKDKVDAGRLVVGTPDMVGMVTNVTKTVESIYADVDILDTAMGNAFEAVLKSDIVVKYSVVATGKYEKDNDVPTIENVDCITVDLLDLEEIKRNLGHDMSTAVKEIVEEMNND